MSNIQPYIILNGTDSRSISGLLISSLPPISKPQVRTQIETVDGRDGDIVTPLGFSAYDKVIKIGLTYNYDVDEIIEFFNSEGIATFSNEPDKYYRYAIYEQIDLEKLIKFKTAEVTLHVQPFKFSTTEEPELFDVVSGQAIAVTNEGNTDARPNLTIIGSGDIDVSLNGSQILSIELEDDQAVIIDSEDMNAYAAQSAIREVEADIEPIQDLHGYSKPWIGGGGKNKLNATGTNEYSTLIDGVYTVTSLPQTGYSWYIGWVDLKVGTYILSGGLNRYCRYYIKAGDEYYTCAGEDVSFTLTSDTTVSVSGVFTPEVTVGNKLKPMIRLASVSDASFEPYSNICPISGFNSANITRCGVNLVNINMVNLGDSNPRAVTLTLDKPLPKGTYTLSWATSGTASGSVQVEYDGAFRVVLNGENFTANNNVTKFYFYISNQDYSDGKTCSISNLQLESGTTPHAYEPYNGQTATVNFGQTVYGGVADVTNGKVTITHKKYLLDNTLSESDIAITLASGYTQISYLPIISVGVGNSPFVSDRFENVAQLQAGLNKVWNSNSETAPRLFFGLPDTITTKAQAVAWFASNPTEVIYELATPTEIQLTPTQINNLLGLNNLYSDTGDITVKHKANGVIVTDTGDIVSFYAGLDDIEKGVLLNRAITGDYDKIRLRKGVNTFVLSGNAQQFAIDKFSRWI